MYLKISWQTKTGDSCFISGVISDVPIVTLISKVKSYKFSLPLLPFYSEGVFWFQHWIGWVKCTPLYAWRAWSSLPVIHLLIRYHIRGTALNSIPVMSSAYSMLILISYISSAYFNFFPCIDIVTPFLSVNISYFCVNIFVLFLHPHVCYILKCFPSMFKPLCFTRLFKFQNSSLFPML